MLICQLVGMIEFGDIDQLISANGRISLLKVPATQRTSVDIYGTAQSQHHTQFFSRK